jgi:alanine racemase
MQDVTGCLPSPPIPPFADDPDAISGPWIEVNLAALDHNLDQIHRQARTALMPVIKANAYGHGLVAVGRHLARHPAVRALAVGTLREAFELRHAGVERPVLNLGPFSAAEAQPLVALGIAQSVFTRGVEWLDRAAAAQGRTARVHLKIDTGLGRVGVEHDRAVEFARMVAGLPHVRIQGVFTTLSEDPRLDRVQMERFQAVLAGLAALGIDPGWRHAASSAAILASPRYALDLVRPGIMVFGHYPSADACRRRPVDLRPALALKTRVVYVKRLRAGDPVGYHGVYRAPADEVLITGAIGYPDGYPVQAAGRAEALIHGVRHPLVAPVTANHIYLRGGLPTVAPGDEIVLYGRQEAQCIPLEEVAAAVARSAYNLLARLNPLLPRFYRGGQGSGTLENRPASGGGERKPAS